MTGFEQAFEDTEKAASSAVVSAGALVKLARKVQKAAQQGRIGDVKRAQRDLAAAGSDLRQAVANVIEAWPFGEEDEEFHLREHYARELRYAAEELGLDIYEQDGKLISHPSIVRVLPARRAITIGGKQVSAIRPGYVARLLLDSRNKPVRHKSDAFLEALYRVYSDIEQGEVGRVVPLARIYKLFTSLPGARRESVLYWIRDAGHSGTVVLLDNRRVTLARNPRDGVRYYTRAMAMDHYELLREFVDDVDRLAGTLMLVATDEGFLDGPRSFDIYEALKTRVMDDVRDRNLVNPVASLVRLSQGEPAA